MMENGKIGMEENCKYSTILCLENGKQGQGVNREKYLEKIY